MKRRIARFVYLWPVVGLALMLPAGSAQSLGGLPERLAGLIGEATRAISLRYEPGGISPVLRAVLLGVALSATGQIGDLIESSFKRDAKIKDSGKALPQYGGILDMLDSPLFAVPVGWFLLTVVWAVV